MCGEIYHIFLCKGCISQLICSLYECCQAKARDNRASIRMQKAQKVSIARFVFASIMTCSREIHLRVFVAFIWSVLNGCILLNIHNNSYYCFFLLMLFLLLLLLLFTELSSTQLLIMKQLEESVKLKLHLFLIIVHHKSVVWQSKVELLHDNRKLL